MLALICRVFGHCYENLALHEADRWIASVDKCSVCGDVVEPHYRVNSPLTPEGKVAAAAYFKSYGLTVDVK